MSRVNPAAATLAAIAAAVLGGLCGFVGGGAVGYGLVYLLAGPNEPSHGCSVSLPLHEAAAVLGGLGGRLVLSVAAERVVQKWAPAGRGRRR